MTDKIVENEEKKAPKIVTWESEVNIKEAPIKEIKEESKNKKEFSVFKAAMIGKKEKNVAKSKTIEHEDPVPKISQTTSSIRSISPSSHAISKSKNTLATLQIGSTWNNTLNVFISLD